MILQSSTNTSIESMSCTEHIKVHNFAYAKDTLRPYLSNLGGGKCDGAMTPREPNEDTNETNLRPYGK